MSTGVTNVRVLCTGNSARSIVREATGKRIGDGRFRGFPAGSFPKRQVHPGALRLQAIHDDLTEVENTSAGSCA